LPIDFAGVMKRFFVETLHPGIRIFVKPWLMMPI
jgi:hypothetical protein